MKRKRKIDQLADLISHDGRYWAETQDDHYLIRFNRVDNDRNNLVLMFDLGVTWEPFKAYPTPRFCTVDITDIPKAARNLMRLADAWAEGRIEYNAKEDSAQHFMK